MAFTVANLVLLAHGADKKHFYYSSSGDTLATINTAGYFNNTDDAIRMAAGDIVFVKASDAEAALIVTAVSSGSVTTRVVSDVVNYELVGAGSTQVAAFGVSRVGSTTGGLKAVSLDAPVAGARKSIVVLDSTGVVVSATHVGATFDGTNGKATLAVAGTSLQLVGLSATRWGVLAQGGVNGATYVTYS